MCCFFYDSVAAFYEIQQYVVVNVLNKLKYYYYDKFQRIILFMIDILLKVVRKHFYKIFYSNSKSFSSELLEFF